MIKCDLHCHTLYSYDSSVSPKEMVEAALEKGINCLAITDHGQVRGAQEAVEYAKDKPILIIPGIEIKSKEGDILGLNVKEIIPNKLSAKETIKRIKSLGGMAIIAHPSGWFCRFTGDLKELGNEIDAIEVLNASFLGSGNKKAQESAKRYNLAFTAGSDAHISDFVGRCYLEIAGDSLSLEEILGQIKNKKVKVGGKEVSFSEKVIDHIKRSLTRLLKYVR